MGVARLPPGEGTRVDFLLLKEEVLHRLQETNGFTLTTKRERERRGRMGEKKRAVT